MLATCKLAQMLSSSVSLCCICLQMNKAAFGAAERALKNMQEQLYQVRQPTTEPLLLIKLAHPAVLFWQQSMSLLHQC